MASDFKGHKLSLNEQHQSTEGNSNQEKSPNGFIVSSPTTGLLKKGMLLLLCWLFDASTTTQAMHTL